MPLKMRPTGLDSGHYKLARMGEYGGPFRVLEVFVQIHAGPALAQQTGKRCPPNLDRLPAHIGAAPKHIAIPAEKAKLPSTCSDIRPVLVALARFSAISFRVHSQMVGDYLASGLVACRACASCRG